MLPALCRLPVPGTFEVRSFVSVSSVAMRPVALGLTLLAVTGGHAAYEASAKTITVSVDGRPQQVRAHVGTVGDVLAAAHLTVGQHDLLAPQKASTVKDGGTIVLRRGREMDLTVDGKVRNVWVTAMSVNEALDQIGLRAPGAILSADRSRAIPLKGFSLDIRTRKTVQVLDAGRVRKVGTNALVLSELLRQSHIVVRKQDRLSLPVTTAVRNGLVVRITRVDGGHAGEETPVAFAVLHRADATMYKGTSRVVRQGQVGVLHRNFSLTFVNGVLHRRVLTSARITERPIAEVIDDGTLSRPVPPPVVTQRTVSVAGGLNWGALAGCESGGNPRAVSPGGDYRGLYQFSLSTWSGVGGSGDPIDASASEQTYRAQVLYGRAGRSSWPVCGRYL